MTIWETLGIAAASDRDTIRRAYARKLRQTNPEDDPEGFMQLREAYDTALRHADFREQSDHQDNDAEHCAAESEEPEAVRAQPADEHQDQASPEQIELQGYAMAILTALQSPDPAQWQEALTPLEALLASDAMEQLELRRSAENWLAHQIASYTPQSDALIDRAIEYFDWETVGFRHGSSAIEAVLRRRAEQLLANQLQHPDHPLHLAWRRLQGPKPGDWLLLLQALLPADRKKIQTLLLHVQAYPGLSFYLDADTVAWWRGYLSQSHLVEAFAFTPVGWLMAFVLLTAVKGQLVPDSSDAILAIPPALVGAAVFWWVTRRAFAQRITPPVVLWAERAWMIGLVALPLVALLLPLETWVLALIAALVIVILGLQDIDLAHRPLSHPLPFNPTAYFAPLMLVFVMSTGITAPFALAWYSILAGMAVGWFRGQYELPMRLLRIPVLGRRIAFPIVFAALLGLSWAIMAPSGPWHYYHLGLAILLCGPLIRIIRLIEPAGLYRQILAPLAGLALIVLWVATSPVERHVPAGIPDVPLVDDTTPADAVFRSTEATEQPSPRPRTVCPNLAKDKRKHPGATALRLCGTLTQWFSGTDYPPEALDHHKQGVAKVVADVGVDGRVHGCRTVKSSGDASLDETTCRVIEDVGRFLPARDADGRPLPAQFSASLDWVYPQQF